MGLGIWIVPETIRTNVGTASTYASTSPDATLGGPLLFQARYLKFTNLTNATLMVSWDGIHDHFIYPPDSFDVIDVTAMRARYDGAFGSIGTQFYVRYVGDPAGSGLMYLSVLYARGN